MGRAAAAKEGATAASRSDRGATATGDVVLMGPPGVGKGTQARVLADSRGWVHVATGDLFRDHTRRGSELGTVALAYMERGEYVPDDVTVDMVRERLAEIPPTAHVVFDGFPRTVAQAEALDRLLAEIGRRVARVVLFEAPREVLLGRLSARATCSRCQAVYSLAVRPPRVAGVCDRCGGPVTATARPDESPEVVRRRLEVYEVQTRPVVDHYAAGGLLRRVSGVGPLKDVSARVAEALSGIEDERGAASPGRPSSARPEHRRGRQADADRA